MAAVSTFRLICDFCDYLSNHREQYQIVRCKIILLDDSRGMHHCMVASRPMCPDGRAVVSEKSVREGEEEREGLNVSTICTQPYWTVNRIYETDNAVVLS